MNELKGRIEARGTLKGNISEHKTLTGKVNVINDMNVETATMEDIDALFKGEINERE